MIQHFRIAFGLKTGSSILTFRARQVPNAPEACLEARWRDWQFEKWAGLLPLKHIPLIEQGRKFLYIFLENANVLVKMALRKIFPNVSI